MDLSTAFNPHHYSGDEQRSASRYATKRSFASGKVRKVLAGSSTDAREIHAGAVTMCLNTVAQFLPGWADPIDMFVWDGDMYVSRQSGRVLYTS